MILTIAKFYFATHAELLPEEAYYWTYLQHPALSYFDHPPMVAWIVGAGTWVFGDTELGVRFGTIFLSLGSSLLIFLLSRLWFGQIAAGWAALLFNLLPIFIGVGQVTFPDGPLVFFWLLTMYAVSKAVKSVASKSPGILVRSATLYWLLAGVGFGGAMLSKYTAVMLGVSLGLFLIMSRSQGQWFLRPQPWLAAVVALLIFSPVIVWNAQHEWSSFLFQSTRTVGQRPQALKNVLVFWFTQVAILGPIPFVLLAATAARSLQLGWLKRQDRWNFAVSFFLPLFAVFVLASFKTEVHVNWTAPAFLSLIIAAGAIFQAGLEGESGFSPRRWQQAAWAVIAFAVLALALANAACIWGIPGGVAYSHVGGWRQLATSVKAATTDLGRTTGQKPFVVGVDKYNIAAELSFYGGEPENTVNSVVFGAQGLGFRYWTKIDTLEGRPAVAVLRKMNDAIMADLRANFARVDVPKQLEISAVGSRVRTMWLVDCYGYREKVTRSP